MLTKGVSIHWPRELTAASFAATCEVPRTSKSARTYFAARFVDRSYKKLQRADVRITRAGSYLHVSRRYAKK